MLSIKSGQRGMVEIKKSLMMFFGCLLFVIFAIIFLAVPLLSLAAIATFGDFVRVNYGNGLGLFVWIGGSFFLQYG